MVALWWDASHAGLSASNGSYAGVRPVALAYFFVALRLVARCAARPSAPWSHSERSQCPASRSVTPESASSFRDGSHGPSLGDPSHEPCRWCDPPECAPFPLRPVLLGRILLGRVSVGRVPVGFVGVRPLALRRGPLRFVPVREVPTRTARSPSATRRSAIAVRQKAAAGFEPASILSPSPLLRPLS